MTTTNLSSAARRRSGRGFGPRRALGIAASAAMLALLWAWLLAPGAVAYIGQNPYAVRLDGPSGTVPCSAPVTITATVRTADSGALVSGQAVLWSLKITQSPKDQVKPTRSVTRSDGTTTTQLTFGPVSGKRKVQAMVADYPATITVTCDTSVTSTPTPLPTPAASGEPATTPEPLPTPAESGQPASSSASPATSPAPSASGAATLPTPSVPPPSTTAAAGAATPAPTPDAGASPDANAEPGGISAPLVLVGGLIILGGMSALLWSITRRRSRDGQPPA